MIGVIIYRCRATNQDTVSYLHYLYLSELLFLVWYHHRAQLLHGSFYDYFYSGQYL